MTKIQDMYVRRDGPEVTTTRSRFGVLDSTGRVVYSFALLPDGSLEVRAGEPVRHGDSILDARLHIAPSGFDRVSLFRPIEAF